MIAFAPVLFSLACAKEQAQPAPASTTNASASVTPPAASAPATTDTPAAPPSTAAADLTVGKPAPDFTAPDQNGKPIHLAELHGKNVVVYFYPKDETPGCTKEACAFRDAWDGLAKKNVVLIGVSADTDASHRAFIEHHKLPFLLVSDANGALAAKFGVPVKEGYEMRQSFVIGPDGNVKKIYRKVDVTTHAAEIAGDVQ
jgi:peroxiredoxin Q/BCP